MLAEHSRRADPAAWTKRMSRIVDVPEAEPEKDGDTRLSLVAPSIEQSPDRMCIRFGLPFPSSHEKKENRVGWVGKKKVKPEDLTITRAGKQVG